MTDKELDDLFSKSFSDHEMPVPPDMWQRVNPQQEDKRRVLFWWWSGLGIAALLLLVGGAMYFSPSSSNTKQIRASVSSSKEIAKHNTQQTGGKTSDKQTSSAPDSIHEETEVPSVSSPGKAMKERADKPHNNLVAGKRNTTISHHPANLLPASSDQHHDVISKNKEAEKATPFTPVYESGKDNEITAGKSANAPEEKAAIAKQKEDSTQQTSANDAAKNSIAKQASKEAAATPVHISKIHGEKTTGIELMVSGYENDRDVYGVKTNTPQTLVSLGAIDHKSKTSIRGFSINLRVDKPLTKNISLKGGLQFMQAHQQVSYDLKSVNQFAIVNSLGITNDTMRFARIQSEEPEVKSVYNSISVPLLLAYHTNGGKINIGASAGVLVNLISWYSGKVPDADYQQTLAAKSTFKHNTGASLYLSFGTSRNFGGYQLFAEPNVQYNLSSITKNTAGFKQRMAAYGIGIGVRKRIWK